MRCPIIVGRDGPVSRIAEAVRRLGSGAHGGALVVLGEAGIGKTRLAEHAREAAARAGVTAVTGRALPDASGSPLRPVAEALLELTRGRRAPVDEELAPYATVLASLVPHWRSPVWSPPGEPVVVTAEAVLRILRWATGGAGAVLILEDLHWADDATLEVARYLADHASEVPLLVFGTARTGEGRDDVPALLAAGGAEICEIGRLTDEQAEAMARACAGPAWTDDSASAVVRAAEGLPLLVEDLLATGDLAGFPPRFAGTVRARLARLDTRHRAVVDAAAVLGRRFDWRLLERAAGASGADVAAALHRSAALQLITADVAGFAFRHALTRDVVLADLAVPDRCRLSLAAAGALLAAAPAAAEAPVLAGAPVPVGAPGAAGVPGTAGDHGEDLALMIGRLLAEGGEPLRAARTLLDAGRRAFAAGSLSSAELLLDEADRVSSRASGRASDRASSRASGHDEDLQSQVSVLRAKVLLQAGRPADATDVASRVVTAADGRDLAVATAMRMVLARAAVMTGEWQSARLHLADVRRAAASAAAGASAPAAALAPAGAAGTAVSGETRAELEVIDAHVALGDTRPGSREQAERLAATAAATARSAERPDLACEALEVLGLSARLHDLDAAHAALSRALDVAAAADLRVHRLRILNELGTVEMLRDARGIRLEQARHEAARAGAVGLAAGIGANIAALLAMTARYDDAIAVAGEVERTAGRLGLVPLRAAALLMQGFALAHQGRSRDAERCLSAAEAAAPDDADLRAGAWGIGRGIGALVAEDRDGARRAFARARAEAPGQHARILNPYEGPELLLRAVAGEAGPADVEAAAAGAVRAARWPDLWFGAARAVVTGAAGDRELAAAALAAALRAGDRYPVFSALTRRLVAEAAITDRWGEPAALLRDADATFARLRLGRSSAACRALLKQAGHTAPRRRAGDAGLPTRLVTAGITTREAEVLDLLADRLSNREIAELLFLSPRTVEKHVAALLAKLGAGDRGGLARLARSLR